MANVFEYASVFQSELDKAAVEQATSGWMELNDKLVRYNGGAEVKIPSMDMDGLADYDRDKGFVEGSVNLKWETKEMTQDRGRQFTFDENEVRLIDLSIDGRVEADGCTNVIELSNVRFNVTGSDYGYGVRVLRSVAVKIYNCTINNAAVAAISIDTSTAYIYNLSGTGNAIAVSSGDSAQGGPALVVIGNSSITGDIKYQKVYGGAILENGVLV